MTNRFPIFIPTKGRFSPKTLKQLPDAVLVVEPQEAKMYQSVNPNAQLLVLPFSKMGIAFARQSILNYARSQQLDWYWIIDDDIHGFYRFQDKKSIRISGGEALTNAEMYFSSMPNIGQGCLDNSQYAWASTKTLSESSGCTACVCINVKATQSLNYDLSLLMKEDIDFSLKILNAGLLSVRLHKFGYSTPKVGTLSGGLKPLYDDPNNDLKASQDIVDRWGSKLCKIVSKKTGRVDVRIKWKLVADHLQLNHQPRIQSEFKLNV